ncbi:MAG: hypothetical protein IPL43_11230 [Micropruina sp.]|nr:hypothetical protein [Micropruina sp.]
MTAGVIGQVEEIAERLPAEHWSVVGGLMVQLHAARAALAHFRLTHDLDMVIRPQRASFARVAEVLGQLGYVLRQPLDPRGYAHRFIRDGDVVDVMLPEGVERSFRGHRLVAVPASRSALKRVEWHECGRVRG